MLSDRYGLGLTTSSSAARDAYVAGCDGVLGAMGEEIAQLTRATELDPDFALAQVALARAHFLTANVPAARKGVARARELASGVSAREQSHINALCLGMEGKPVEALAATRAHLAEHPRDAMVAAPATGVFGLIGFSGRQGREPEQVAFLETIKPQLADDWWFQMVYAFALEEVGRLDEASALIERSMAACPRSAHGAHIKAHVLYEQGENRAGLAYLQGWMPPYPRDGLMHCHISWHIALFALTEGHIDDAWRVYRAGVHPGGAWGPFINVSTDSAAFLWRAELAGQKRNPLLWSELRDYCLRHFPKTGLAFGDVHCALSCVATGDSANVGRILDELNERVASNRYPAGGVVPALVSGFAAYEAGNWRAAIDSFEKALPETVRIGGSRAQRDLAEHTLVAAYLKDGRPDAAKKLIANRVDRHPMVSVSGIAA
jgi:tetratricopeptide (TPR) repeat protein